jgi:hypothetical protein
MILDAISGYLSGQGVENEYVGVESGRCRYARIEIPCFGVPGALGVLMYLDAEDQSVLWVLVMLPFKRTRVSVSDPGLFVKVLGVVRPGGCCDDS